MNPLWFTFGGLAWWLFFESLRGLPRYRKTGTQDLVMFGLLGLVVSIGGTLVWLMAKIGERF